MAALEHGSAYVAMGSSFAAGPGVGQRVPGSPRRAGRSSSNYAHLVAREFGLVLDDVTFSGATTSDILRSPGPDRPAQLDAVTETTKLVTITCGGNDVGYVGGLVFASLPRPLSLLPAVRRQQRETPDPAADDDRFAQLSASLTSIVQEVRRRSPACLIVVTDYLTILPPDDATAAPLPAGVADRARRTADRLTEVFSTVASAEGCLFAGAAAFSAEHHAWSATPWTRRFHYTLRGGAAYHPNAAGMAALAALIGKRIRSA